MHAERPKNRIFNFCLKNYLSDLRSSDWTKYDRKYDRKIILDAKNKHVEEFLIYRKFHDVFKVKEYNGTIIFILR